VSARNRTAIVTGAGQGLGEAVARRLSNVGMRVIVADIVPESAARVAAELPGSVPAKVDVRDIDSLSGLVETAQSGGFTLDVLVNNAGITETTSIWDITEKDWDDLLAVNLRSVFFASQMAGKIMREQRSGRIINMGSLAGQQGGLVAGAHYAASKAGIIVLTKIFARALAPFGVTVNAVAPAAIDGPVMQSFSDERVAEIAKAIPVQRVGRPEEVGALVAFLCSDEAAYITGATVDINGGVSMR
jgi:3-oxoacyl-[acyl-carrier protein] reductase